MRSARLGALLATLLASAPAFAQVSSLAGDSPADARFLLAARDFHTQRTARPGRAVESLLSELGLVDRAVPAARSLAASLSLSTEALSKGMLSREVLWVASDDGSAAMLATIDPELEPRLRQGLKPSPRGLVDGQPVMLLENGAFQLASFVLPRAALQEPAARILIAPGDSHVFERLLPLVRGRAAAAPLRDRAEFAALEALGPGDVAMLYHLSPAGDSAEQASGSRFVAATLSQDRTGWRGEFAASADLLLPPLEAREGPWPAAAVEALSRSSSLLIAAPAGAGRTSSLPSDLALGFLNLDEALADLVCGPAIVSVHRGVPPALDPTSSPVPSGVTSASSALAEAPLCIVLAIPLKDLSRGSRLADAWGFGASRGEVTVPESTGLRELRAAHVPGAQAVSLALADGASLGWTFSSWSREAGASELRGWWVVAILAGSDLGRAAAAADRLEVLLRQASAQRGSQEMARLLIRPGELAGLVGALAGPAFAQDAAAPLRALRWIDRIDLRVAGTVKSDGPSPGTEPPVRGTLAVVMDVDRVGPQPPSAADER